MRPSQKRWYRPIQAWAAASGSELSDSQWSRPLTRRRTRPARSRILMWLETALSDMSNGRARAVTLSGPSAARRQTMLRREPSASAAYTSSSAERSTIRLNISARGVEASGDSLGSVLIQRLAEQAEWGDHRHLV